jgi:capsular exopolysaccharide synthesis family protein
MSASSREGAGLVDVLAVLRRRARIVLLSIAAVVAAALIFSFVQDKEYTASASLLVRQESLSNEPFSNQPAFEVADPQRALETNLRLVTLGVVAERAAAEIGEGVTAGEVRSSTEFDANEDADLIEVEATSSEPETAARIANGFAMAFVAFRRGTDRQEVLAAQRRIQRQLDAQPTATETQTTPDASRARLQARADELQALADLQTGGVSIVERASEPGSPSSPRPLRNTLIGGFAGLLLGLSLALVLEQTQRRLSRVEDVEDAYGVPLLGTIPEFDLAETANSVGIGDLRAQEAFRMLRANLRHSGTRRRDVQSVLVTSAAPEEGKTTVAYGLAVASAETGARVLLVEADLHRPALAGMLDLNPDQGLTKFLSDRRLGISRVIQPANIGNPKGGDDATIDVIVAGPNPPNPAVLLESDRMAALLKVAEEKFDLVVVDTPPAGAIADPIPLFDRVGGVLLVCRLGQGTVDAVAHFRSQLETIDPPLLGVVANGVRRGAGYPDYGYYADSRASPPSPNQPFNG